MIKITTNENGKTTKSKLKILMFVGIAFAGIGLVGALVMVLWNWIMPDVFGLSKITLIQGYGLLILAKLIFGGMQANTTSGTKNNNLDDNTKAYIKESIHQEIKENNINDYSINEDTDADELYEQWWSDEGEAYFDEYLTKKSDTND